jgi:hypothetical protein
MAFAFPVGGQAAGLAFPVGGKPPALRSRCVLGTILRIPQA